MRPARPQAGAQEEWGPWDPRWLWEDLREGKVPWFGAIVRSELDHMELLLSAKIKTHRATPQKCTDVWGCKEPGNVGRLLGGRPAAG